MKANAPQTTRFAAIFLALIAAAITPVHAQITVGGNGANTTDATVYSGSQSLTKIGSNTVTLTASNTYTGETFVNTGTLSAANSSALGAGGFSAGTKTTIANGATLGLQGNISLDEHMHIFGSGVGGLGAIRNLSGNNSLVSSGYALRTLDATLGADAGQLTISGSLYQDGGVYGLTKVGAGSVVLSGANSYGSETIISEGTLVAANNTALGTGGFSGTTKATVYGGATLALQGNISMDEHAHIFGSGVGGLGAIRNLSGTNALTSAYALRSDVVLGADAGQLTIGRFYEDGGTFGVTKVGAGAIVLSGSNTYGGATIVSEGSLATSGNNLLAAGGSVTVNSNATFTLGGNQTLAAVTGAGSVQVGANTLSFGASNGTFSGVISGTGALAKVGAGTTTLSGANTYSGESFVNAGTLVAANNSALGTGGFSAFTKTTITNGATLALQGNVTLDEHMHIYGSGVGGQGAIRSLSGTNALTSGYALRSDAVVGVDAGQLTFAGSVYEQGGTYGLSKVGNGAVVLAASNNYGGETIVSAGTLVAANNSALGTGGFSAFTKTTITNGATLALQGNISMDEHMHIFGSGVGGQGAIRNLSGSNSLTSSGYALKSDAVLGADAGQLTFSGGLYQDGGTYGISKVGAGTIVLAGASSYDGTTTISAGTLQVGSGGTTGTLGSGNVTNNALLVFNRSNGLAVSNAISGSGSLAQSGTGTTTLSGANTYTGGTTISAGTLQVGNGGTTGTLGTGNVTNNASLVVNRANALSLSNTISGTGSLVQAGTGTTTLSGSNTYSGGTTISAGTLQVGNGGTAGTLGTGNVTNNAALVLNRANALSVSNTISGTGSVTQNGAGVTTLSASNTYTGGTTVNAGRLATSGNERLADSGAVTVNTNGTFATGGDETIASLAGAGAVELGGRLTTGANNSTYSGSMSGLGGLTKSGAGTFTLSGASTFTGDTMLSGGTLVLANANALWSGGVLSMDAGTTLTVNQRTFVGALDQGGGTVNGPGQLVATLTLTDSGALNAVLADGPDFAAGILKRTAGTTTVGAANTFTGAVNVQGGTLQLGAGGSFDAASTLALSSGATMDLGNKAQTFSAVQGAGGTVAVGSGSLTVNNAQANAFGGSITGTGGVTKNGAGALTLNGTSTYSGATAVNAGTLVVDGSADSSTVTVNSGATLSGSGSIGGLIVNSGGTINPGNSPGTQTVAGNATWNAGGNYNWQILDAAGSAGTGWDLLNVTGTLDLSALSLGNEFEINLWSLSSIGPDVSGNALNFNSGQNYTWTIASAASGITGFTGSNQFSINTSANNGAAGFANALNGGSFSIAQSGNDLNLVFTAAVVPPGPAAVPEPGTWAAAALLAGGAYLRWRKRRQAKDETPKA